MVKTKIFATLGPASSSETVLRKMITSGLDGVRLNFSHGSYKEHLERVNLVRRLNNKLRRSVKIMQDLEGYRIRIGALAKPIELKKGMRFYLTQNEITIAKEEIPFDYKGSLKLIKNGVLIYVDDGKIIFEVKAVERLRLKVKCLVNGLLKEHKGINIPDAKLDFEALTKKDKIDVEFSVQQKVNYVAQSFVNKAKDLELLKEIIKPRHKSCFIFAKIESREALKHLEEIIDEADGIIVARGDLGVCVPIYKVPLIQKDIVRRCLVKNKPVMVATQMLDSMTDEVLPTRAEVSDVANAILDGATHLLLSAETAVGKYPDKTVDMMNKIVKYTEDYGK